ncbi:MAG: PP2C family protein-serine/threonine phosphatase [Methylosarcina sp.]
MSWKFGAATDIGGRSEQQDRLVILHSRNKKQHLLVVADGMGGMKDGAKAAQILVDVATDHFTRHKVDKPYAFLEEICRTTHHTINNLQNATQGLAPGTTALLLYIDKQTAYWAHVGDSRLYHFRKGSLVMHTNDHSMMQLMIEKGLVQAGSLDATAMQNQLYMRLGGDRMPEPDFNTTIVEDGDLFLLCSDGFWQAVQPNEMVAAIEQSLTDQEGPKYLVKLARQRGGDGCDNISLAVSQWNDSAGTGWGQRLANFLLKRCFYKT